MDYYTTYYWKVLEVVPNCNTWGPLWHFQTEEDPTPVELTSFTAQSASYGVELNWSTATETNNQGFEIERKQSVGNFEEIGFVAGFGTTTEPKSYSFKDANLEYGTYIYRLKQIDYDGTFSNSCEVNIILNNLIDYSLEQNYPNPFNPSTKIKYSIPSNSKGEMSNVVLKVFDVLGNEIATLVDEFKPAGSYEVEFNPVSSIKNPASGIYFYQIRAENFVQTKKMLLVK